MNKYLTLVIASSLLLSACGSTKQNIETKIGQVEDKVKNKVEEKKTSIKDLLGMGVEQKCEWSSEVDNAKTSGKMWIKGKKIRQSVLTQVGSEPEVEAEVITDGEWTYIWNPKTKEQGMKVRVTEEEKEKSKEMANGSIDWGKEYNYKCSPANVSDEEMMPPKDVTFMDLGTLQEQFKNLVPSGVNIPKDGE